MTIKDYRILARWVSLHSEELADELARFLNVYYENFDYAKFIEYADKERSKIIRQEMG